MGAVNRTSHVWYCQMIFNQFISKMWVKNQVSHICFEAQWYLCIPLWYPSNFYLGMWLEKNLWWQCQFRRLRCSHGSLCFTDTQRCQILCCPAGSHFKNRDSKRQHSFLFLSLIQQQNTCSPKTWSHSQGRYLLCEDYHTPRIFGSNM